MDLSPVLSNQLGRFDLSGLDLEGVGNAGAGSLSFTDLVWQAINGELPLSLQGILDAGAGIFINELRLNGALIRQLLIITVLSAIIKCLSDSFKNKSAGELSFFVSYVLVVMLAFSSFQVSISILSELIAATTGMMEAAIPLIISLTVMSGNVTGAAAFQPVLIFAIQLMSRFVSFVFIPMLVCAAVLQIVNFIAEGNMLTKMTVLIKKGADWMLKGIVYLFVLLLSLQKISAPIINNAAVKTAKAAAGAVPVVGGALNSAMDSVLYWSEAAKSGVMAALVIVLCVSVAVPLLKMLVFMLIYKLVAALVQPICDDRIVNCLDGMGNYTGLLLSAGAMAAVMFVLAVVIMLAF